MPGRILVIDDESQITRVLRASLSSQAFDVRTSNDPEEGLRLFSEWRPDLVISEPTEYAGPMAARSAGIPWVEHSWGLAAHPAVITRRIPFTEAARALHRAPDDIKTVLAFD